MMNEATNPQASADEGQSAPPALLDCPFCGSDDVDVSFVRGYERGDQTQPVVGAGCMSCGAAGPTVRVPDHSTGYIDAAAMWNVRAT